MGNGTVSLGCKGLLFENPGSEIHPHIQRLIDAGATVVGTTMLCPFATREEPWLCTEQAPYNPRGDGEQSPGGGSPGSAVAVASYPWLDAAIGSGRPWQIHNLK